VGYERAVFCASRVLGTDDQAARPRRKV
jgi:hypothetical protein